MDAWFPEGWGEEGAGGTLREIGLALGEEPFSSGSSPAGYLKRIVRQALRDGRLVAVHVGKQPLEDPDAYDTINTTVVPIVFVPGVMGSRLDIPGGSDWDPDYQPSMAGWLACSTRAGRKDLADARLGGSLPPGV